jgi:homoserine dehydrogenase
MKQEITGSPVVHPVEVTQGLGVVAVVGVTGGTTSWLLDELQSFAPFAHPLAMTQ